MNENSTHNKTNDYIANNREAFLGLTNRASNGQMMEVIGYDGYENLTVRFEDGTVVTGIDTRSFKIGYVRNPNCVSTSQKDRTGETNLSTAGQKMTIIAYRHAKDIDVQFEDGSIVEHRQYTEFQNGTIQNPNVGYVTPVKESRVGESKEMANGQVATIISYLSYNNMDIQFADGTIVKNVSYERFAEGKVKNPTTDVISKRDLPNFKDYTGETNTATNGMQMQVIASNGANDITVQFEDGTIVEHQMMKQFRRGSIKHPTKPALRGKRKTQ